MKTHHFIKLLKLGSFPFKFSQQNWQVRLAAKKLRKKKNIMAIIKDNNYQDTTTNKFKHTRTPTMVEANIQRRSEHGWDHKQQKKYKPPTTPRLPRKKQWNNQPVGAARKTVSFLNLLRKLSFHYPPHIFHTKKSTQRSKNQRMTSGWAPCPLGVPFWSRCHAVEVRIYTRRLSTTDLDNCLRSPTSSVVAATVKSG